MKSTSVKQQYLPFDHQTALCSFYEADDSSIKLVRGFSYFARFRQHPTHAFTYFLLCFLIQAIESALKAKPLWESMPFNDRAAIFLKAADLLATKYR